jgi:alpha-beta hydrolase superfamily lysophospholipase
MMPSNKESYRDLAGRLADKGYAGIAIDFRGHGASQDGPEGYLSFSDAQHQQSREDVDAALKFLEGKLQDDAMQAPLAIVGASIGANLGLQRAIDDPRIKAIILLSPGLDYRGVTTKNLITRLRPDQRILLASSQDDDHNTQDVEELYGLIQEGIAKKKLIYEHAGHGTAMLEHEPDLEDEIISFIAQDLEVQ